MFLEKNSYSLVFNVLAEVGGWLGLLLGASIISLGELLYFFVLLGNILVQKVFMFCCGTSQANRVNVKSH